MGNREYTTRLLAPYQPQRELRTGLIVGIDCMLGWTDGDAALLRVNEAITAAESARRVGEAARWVLNSALRDCAELRRTSGVDLRVTVAFSARDLRLPELPDFIAGTLKVWNMRPSRLALCITDTAILPRRPETCEMLRRLGKMGVRLAINEPAFGYAALAHLATLPFNEMRLDAAPLPELAANKAQQAIVRAMIGIAHDLRLEVLAEGVAEAATAECLQGLGCDLIQGEHVGAARDPEGYAAAFGQ